MTVLYTVNEYVSKHEFIYRTSNAPRTLVVRENK